LYCREQGIVELVLTNPYQAQGACQRESAGEGAKAKLVDKGTLGL